MNDLLQTAQLQLLTKIFSNNNTNSASSSTLKSTSNAQPSTHDMPSSSPPSEAVTLQQYAADNKLTEEQVTKLERLGWEPALPLSLDQKIDAVGVGFKALEWELLVKKDSKWRKK